MKLKKLTAALVAAATALTPLAFNASVPVSYAGDTGAIANLPDWIPSDFDSAVEFRNNYGATHIDNGLICIVYPDRARKGRSEDTYGYELKPSEGMGAELKHEIYTHELTETCFDVFVYQPLKQGDIDLTIVDPHEQVKETPENQEPSAIAGYSFTVDKSLNITETDIFSWLPDSKSEYNEYTKKNGDVSVKDNYVVFCTMKVDQFGDKWEPDSNNRYENIKYLLTSDCTMQVPDLYDDGSIDKIYVYQAVKDGTEKISWIRTSDVRPDPDEPTTCTLTADCAVLDNAQTILLPGQVRVSLVDADTNEPIIYKNDSDTEFGYMLFRECDLGDGYIENPAITGLNANPSIVQYADLSKDREYTFHLEKSSEIKNYSIVGTESSINRNDNNSYNLVFKLKFTPTGDVNDDGSFNIADVVLLQKWLLCSADVKLVSWKAADFCNDNELNVFDLCLMKKALVQTLEAPYVEPDNYIEFAPPYLTVLEDGLTLYSGPDKSYSAIASIPRGEMIREIGYQNNDDKWIFTRYRDKYGWVRIFKDDDVTQTVRYEAVAAKPVIYLYPEQKTDVHVELELTEAELSTTYPKYNNGWDVTAYPDGKLVNKADGTHHRYLFWDAVNCRTRFDFSKGFCVAGSDTESFLREKLAYMGLTEDEMNEFIVYWLPLMEHNRYNLISFQGDVYTDSAKLNITPSPDSLLRVFMAYVPLEDAIDIEPQQLETFERNGFTVVEWGGSRIQ
ncbi:dockerin type I repeat-containing protein [uncultured Ruminococcus sp.]|uniref:dockerin type I repeat-containing protein n=1 Tax=uncultured Ruminococcus sp. TaxID=165186 RepID=UPI002606033E|nr:dockerin type I repeat-containing protein [uncultured Ruminococcus sp.]